MKILPHMGMKTKGIKIKIHMNREERVISKCKNDGITIEINLHDRMEISIMKNKINP